MNCGLCSATVTGSKCSRCGLALNESPIVTPLAFGRHRGLTVEQVYSLFPSYLEWMISRNAGTPAQRAAAHMLLKYSSTGLYQKPDMYFTGSQTQKVSKPVSSPIVIQQKAIVPETKNHRFNYKPLLNWLVAILFFGAIGYAVIASGSLGKSAPTPAPNPVVKAAPTNTPRPPTPTATPTAQELSARGELKYSTAGCVIKGNVEFYGDEKIYHVPGGRYYDSTVIDPRYGERWFCTEQDAINNGWRKSTQ